jgi:tetratricopeptide (TPR) repeat protein
VAFAITTVTSTGAWEDDLSLFERSYQTAPHNPLAGVDLAQTYYADQRVDECMALLRTVVKENPNYFEANYILGLTYYRTGHYPEAEKYLTIATQVWTRQFVYADASLFYYLGIVQERNGELAEAEKSLRKAIIYQPHALSYYAVLSSLLDREGRHEEAQEALRFEAENRRLYTQKQKAFNP